MTDASGPDEPRVGCHLRVPAVRRKGKRGRCGPALPFEPVAGLRAADPIRVASRAEPHAVHALLMHDARPGDRVLAGSEVDRHAALALPAQPVGALRVAHVVPVTWTAGRGFPREA